MTATSRSFPPDFRFGVATAALQIEGATAEDGRTDSIWDAFGRIPGAIEKGHTVEVACDHYHRYRGDIALMKRLGIDTYRFSTAWSRVRPDGGPINPAGVAFYDRLVDELLAADITPWVTLYHWDLPQAIQDAGGWAERKSADLFTEYALSLHDALGDRVINWTTLNEPWCASFLSYTAGVHAPGHRSIAEGLLAAHHLLLGHGQVVTELRRRDPALSLGITLNLTVTEPANPDDPRDVDAARRIDGQFNRWFLDPIFRGGYPADVLIDIRKVDPRAADLLDAAIAPGDLDTIATRIDVLGVNYYHGEYVGGSPPVNPPVDVAPATTLPTRSAFPAADEVYWYERGLSRTVMGWEVQPAGLTELLARLQSEYTGPAGIPLYVTENGAAYEDTVVYDDPRADGASDEGPVIPGRVDDPERTAFLRDHLAAILDAVDAGVDVRGYFYWSLMDNFEWTWGYAKRFGLIYVDFGTQRRIIKASGHAYAGTIARRAL